MQHPPSRLTPFLLLACLLSLGALAVWLPLDAASSSGGDEGSRADADAGGSLTAGERAFLASHWDFPLAPQGEPPASFTELEASLRPEDCGTCHPRQHRDWKQSRHAIAMGPGVMGQLVDMSNPGAVRSCQRCHAPLAEQAPQLAGGDGWRANPDFERELRHEGLVCASCHVRAHQRFGPPAQGAAAALDPSNPALPHGGFQEETAFGKSAFCRECHQFEADGFALNGKLLENTYEEWRASEFAERGVQCQDCHMPERRHLWKGIHDRDMVAGGVDIGFDVLTSPSKPGDTVRAEIRVRSTGVGHYFPTYVTPQVFLRGVLLDAGGEVLPATRREAVIGRGVALNLSRELYDTRLAPGEERSVVYEQAVPEEAASLRVEVEVEPDHFYERFFEMLLRQGRPAAGEAEIREALEETRASPFILFERTVKLDSGAGTGY